MTACGQVMSIGGTRMDTSEIHRYMENASFQRSDYFTEENVEVFSASNINVAMILFRILHELKEINRKLDG